jgi:hypothetical protein
MAANAKPLGASLQESRKSSGKPQKALAGNNAGKSGLFL